MSTFDGLDDQTMLDGLDAKSRTLLDRLADDGASTVGACDIYALKCLYARGLIDIGGIGGAAGVSLSDRGFAVSALR